MRRSALTGKAVCWGEKNLIKCPVISIDLRALTAWTASSSLFFLGAEEGAGGGGDGGWEKRKQDIDTPLNEFKKRINTPATATRFEVFLNNVRRCQIICDSYNDIQI